MGPKSVQTYHGPIKIMALGYDLPPIPWLNQVSTELGEGHYKDKVLAAITPKLMAGYKTQRRIERAAPATINKELQLVRHAFNIAMCEWEWCRENPMHRVSMEQVRSEVDRWLTVEEEERLMSASSPWLKEIMVFALNTGMHQGEILNLQWQDVDFARGTLIVMKSKNGTRRTIPLNTKVFDLLGACPSNALFLTGQPARDVVLLPHGENIQILGRRSAGTAPPVGA